MNSTAARSDADAPTDALTGLIHGLGIVVRRGKLVARRAICAADPRLDPTSFPLLAFLSQCPEATLSDVANAQGVSKGTMSRQITRLEELGLISRSADALDSRTLRLRLTDAGNDVIARVRAEQKRVLHEVLKEWDEADVATLSGLLERFAEALPTRESHPDQVADRAI